MAASFVVLTHTSWSNVGFAYIKSRVVGQKQARKGVGSWRSKPLAPIAMIAVDRSAQRSAI